MIPNHVLLPPLSPKQRAEFAALCADFDAAKAQITAYNNEARVKRKRELRDKLKSAPADQLLTIGAELEMLESAFAQAKRGAKLRLRALAPRFGALFSPLFPVCEAHMNKMAERVARSWESHFVELEASPSGQSPLADFLAMWRRSLLDRKRQLELIVVSGAAPCHPSVILPYSAKP